jgi:hypothetical protein
LTKGTERNVDITGGDIDVGEPRGMCGITRDIAGALAVPDNPKLCWPSLAQAVLPPLHFGRGSAWQPDGDRLPILNVSGSRK